MTSSDAEPLADLAAVVPPPPRARLGEDAPLPLRESSNKGMIDANHRRYFYFHASLLLWEASYGAHYPKWEHLWRITANGPLKGRYSPFSIRCRLS